MTIGMLQPLVSVGTQVIQRAINIFDRAGAGAHI